MTKYLIIGQGIAGSVLAHSLWQRGEKSIKVVNNFTPNSSSQIAAGLINPITGRTFGKTWRADEIHPYLIPFYQKCETLLGERFFHTYPIYRLLQDIKSENDWFMRMSDPDFKEYLYTGQVDIQALEHSFAPFRSVAAFQFSGQLQVRKFLAATQRFLESQQAFLATRLEYADLEIENNTIFWKKENIRAENLIFCEGIYGQLNPFFKNLPFYLSKGEALLVHIPNYPFKTALVKRDIFILPWAEKDIYWVGSNYDHHFADESPTLSIRQNFETILQNTLKLPFSVIEHIAAVRPTVKQRRPLIAQHAEFPCLYLFNGLGTKGSSLAPFFANQLCDWILSGKVVDKEVRYS